MISSENIVRSLEHFSQDDYCLLQNEINAIPEIMNEASQRKTKIVFNPAPMTPEVLDYPLHKVDTLIINQVEGALLSGEKSPKGIVDKLRGQYQNATVILTLGQEGLVYSDNKHSLLEFPGRAIEVVDTTAAGDTLIGYYLASLINGLTVSESLETGIIASVLCVTKSGAADSIPTDEEVAQAKTTTQSDEP